MMAEAGGKHAQKAALYIHVNIYNSDEKIKPTKKPLLNRN
jgi:hypothetical protein